MGEVLYFINPLGVMTCLFPTRFAPGYLLLYGPTPSIELKEAIFSRFGVTWDKRPNGDTLINFSGARVSSPHKLVR